MTDRALHAVVKREIESLHEFFVAWFSGQSPNDDHFFAESFDRRFSKNFVLIPPAGDILNLVQISSAIRSSYSSNPAFRIAIRGVVVRRQWHNYALVTYEEWQRNARASRPADNGRIATALFECGDRLIWHHIHETWLPTDVMSAGPYDF